MTHRLLRNIHLGLGVGFTLLWLTYGLSSVQMSHPNWFPMEPTRSEAAIPLTSAIGSPAVAVVAELRALGAIEGDVGGVALRSDTLSFQVVRPGTVQTIEVVDGSALVVTNVGGFMNMLNRLHHYGGFWHDWLALDLWGLLVALASLGLIVLGATGIYLWFRRYEERRVGAVLLALNLAAVLTIGSILRVAG